MAEGLLKVHLRPSREGSNLRPPASLLTFCSAGQWGVDWGAGFSSQLACLVGQAVPLPHPEWPGFWGNHLSCGSYQFHYRSCGSSPRGPPWAGR